MRRVTPTALAGLAVMLGAALHAEATPISLSPGPGACGSSACLMAFGNENSTSKILPVIESLLTGLGYTSLSERSKNEAGPESGPAKAWYATSYNSAALADNDATITWNGPSFIASATTFALIKDGKSKPAWYLFNISGWNGKDTIEFSGFWPAKSGAISHISLYTAQAPPTVPDGGSVIVLLALAFVGMEVARRTLI